MAVLPPDANMTLVALMLSRRRLAEEANDEVVQAEDTGVSASTAEQVWATLFLVVIIVMLVCLCLVCFSAFAQFVGCGSSLGRIVLSCCTGWCGGGDGKKKRNKPSTPKHVLPEARVVGPAPMIADEEQVPLKPKRAVVATSSTRATPKAYHCCGLPVPCLEWFGACGCSFVGCAWLGTCWTRLCGGCGGGGGGGGTPSDRRRQQRPQAPDGGLSFVQNVLTCWRCCGLLPLCCPARTLYTPPPRPRNPAAVATPVPITVVRGTPVEDKKGAGKASGEEEEEEEETDTRPMPGLFFA